MCGRFTQKYTWSEIHGLYNLSNAAAGFASWLDHGSVERPDDLDASVHLFPVSPQVNSPKYDAENCIAPLVAEGS